MCAVITWFCMILIFHPKHNNSTTPDEDFLAEENNQNKQPEVNNNSDISSHYAHASTIVMGDSQISSDYHYKGNNVVHPLSKSGNSSQMTQCDSAFQFGPLPTTPPPFNSDTLYRKNNSIVSTAPSMTTLVSHRQPSLPSIYHGGSTGKSSNRYNHKENAADYFPAAAVSIPMDQEKTLQDLDIGSLGHHHIHRKSVKSLVLQPICDYKEMEAQHDSTHSIIDKAEEYVPPPLSPARKNREVIQSLRLEPDNKLRYTHSMVSSPCNEDIGEFGLHDNSTQEFDLFQKQKALNNSMLTSFKEFGEIKQMTMSHSTSSLLLPLPFEFGSSQSIVTEQDEKQFVNHQREFK